MFSNITLATPSRLGGQQQLKSNLIKTNTTDTQNDLTGGGGRPRTSRGCRNPSPDQFTSYVIPSPVQMHLTKTPSAVVLPVNPPDNKGGQEHDDYDDEDNTYQRLCDSNNNTDDADLQERDVFLGCWLFGSLLRV